MNLISSTTAPTSPTSNQTPDDISVTNIVESKTQNADMISIDINQDFTLPEKVQVFSSTNLTQHSKSITRRKRAKKIFSARNEEGIRALTSVRLQNEPEPEKIRTQK